MKQSRLFVGGVASMAVSVLVVGALLVRKARRSLRRDRASAWRAYCRLMARRP